MKTIEERAEQYRKEMTGYSPMPSGLELKAGYIKGATDQRAIDIDIIPQLYVRWLMIDGEKPIWEEYANQAMED